MAAVLFYRGFAVLSHRSAAAIWGFAPRPAHRVELTIVGGHARVRPGLWVTRAARLDPRDLRRRDGLPVTAPARTMIDVAGCSDWGWGATERALSELRVLKLVGDGQLHAAMERCPSRKGVARLRALLAAEGEAGYTRREAERRMRALVGRSQLPTPQYNAPLLGFEIDVLWRASRLAVEVDGHAAHGHRAAFERDRRRDQILAAAGYRVVRVTWNQLVHEPVAVITRIAQALALAAAQTPQMS